MIKMIKKGTKFKGGAPERERQQVGVVSAESLADESREGCAPNTMQVPKTNARKPESYLCFVEESFHVILVVTVIALASSALEANAQAIEASNGSSLERPPPLLTGENLHWFPEVLQDSKLEKRSSDLDRKSSISIKLNTNKRVRKLLSRQKQILSSFVPQILNKQMILKRPSQQAFQLDAKKASQPTSRNQVREKMENLPAPQPPQLRLIKLEPVNFGGPPLMVLKKAPEVAPMMFMAPAESRPTLSAAEGLSHSANVFRPQEMRQELSGGQLPANSILAAAAAAAAVVAAADGDQEERESVMGEHPGEHERELNQIDQMIKDELEKRLQLNEKILALPEETFVTVPSAMGSSVADALMEGDLPGEPADRSEFTTPSRAAQQIWLPSGEESVAYQRRPLETKLALENSHVQYNDTLNGDQEESSAAQESFRPISGLKSGEIRAKTALKSGDKSELEGRGKLEEELASRQPKVWTEEREQSFVPSGLKTIAELTGNKQSPAPNRQRIPEQSRQRSIIHGYALGGLNSSLSREPLISSMTANSAAGQQTDKQGANFSSSEALKETLRKLRETKARIRELQAELNGTELSAAARQNLTGGEAAGESSTGRGSFRGSRPSEPTDWFKALWSARQQQASQERLPVIERAQILGGQPVRQQEAMNLPLGMFHKGPLRAPARLMASAVGRKLSQSSRGGDQPTESRFRPTSGPIVVSSTISVASDPTIETSGTERPAKLQKNHLFAARQTNRTQEPAQGENTKTDRQNGIEQANERNLTAANNHPAPKLAGGPEQATRQQQSILSSNGRKSEGKSSAESAPAGDQERRAGQKRQLEPGEGAEPRERKEPAAASGFFLGRLLERVGLLSAGGEPSASPNTPLAVAGKLTTERVLFSLIALSCSLATLCLLVILVSLRCSRDRRKRRLGGSASVSATCASGASSAAGESVLVENWSPSSLLADWRRFAAANKLQQEKHREKLILDGTMRNVSLLARHPIHQQPAPAALSNRSRCLCPSCAHDWLLRDHFRPEKTPTGNKSSSNNCTSAHYQALPRGKLPFGAASSVNKLLRVTGHPDSSVEFEHHCASSSPVGQVYARHPVGGTRMRMMQAIEEAAGSPRMGASEMPGGPEEQDGLFPECNCKARLKSFEEEPGNFSENHLEHFRSDSMETAGVGASEASVCSMASLESLGGCGAALCAHEGRHRAASGADDDEQPAHDESISELHGKQKGGRVNPGGAREAAGKCCPISKRISSRLPECEGAGGAACRPTRQPTTATGAKLSRQTSEPDACGGGSRPASYLRAVECHVEQLAAAVAASETPALCKPLEGKCRRRALLLRGDSCGCGAGSFAERGAGKRAALGSRLNSVFSSPISLAASIPAKLRQTLIGRQEGQWKAPRAPIQTQSQALKAKQVALRANKTSSKLRKIIRRNDETASDKKWAQCSAPSGLNQRL